MKKRISPVLLTIVMLCTILLQNITVYAAPEILQVHISNVRGSNYYEVTVTTNREVCSMRYHSIGDDSYGRQVTDRRAVDSYTGNNNETIYGSFYLWTLPQIYVEYEYTTVSLTAQSCACVYDAAGCSCIDIYGLCSCPVISTTETSFRVGGSTSYETSEYAPMDLSFYLGEMRLPYYDWFYGYFLTFRQPHNIDPLSTYKLRIYDSQLRLVYEDSVGVPQTLPETVYLSMHNALKSLRYPDTYIFQIIGAGRHGEEYICETQPELILTEVNHNGAYSGNITIANNRYVFTPRLERDSLYFVEAYRAANRSDPAIGWYRGADPIPYSLGYDFLSLLRIYDYAIDKYHAQFKMNLPGDILFTVSGTDGTGVIEESADEEQFDVDIKSDESMQNALARVTDKSSAVRAVRSAVGNMSAADKANHTMLDRLLLFTETAIRNAATIPVTDDRMQLNKQSITDAERTAAETKTETLAVISDAGVSQTRELRTGVRVKTQARNTFTAQLDRTLSNTTVDVIRIENDNIGISMTKAFLRDNAASGNTPLSVRLTESSLDLGFNKGFVGSAMIYMPPLPGNTNQQAIFNSKGEVVGGKYDPCTNTLTAYVNENGTYYVRNNPKDFSDMQNKSAEMREAVSILASKGIINGETAERFAPDKPITRAQIAQLITKSLSKYDANENGGFTDVRPSDWFFGAAGSAKKHGLMQGTNTARTLFSPTVNIPKDQIVAISARVLREEMGYKTPSNINGFINQYSDAQQIANWSRNDIALATQEGLVQVRTDNRFNPDTVMTRGEAAVILYRMYQKIW